MDKEKIGFLASLVVFIIGVCFLSVIFIRHVLFAVMPFVLAWTVAFIARPWAKKISLKTKLPEKLLRCILSILTVVTFFAIFIAFVWQAVGLIWDTLLEIGEGERFLPILERVMNPANFLFGAESEIPEEMAIRLKDTLRGMLTSVLEGVGAIITAWISNLPKVFVFVVVTVIAMIYFSWDLERVNGKVKALLPVKILSRAVAVKDRFLKAGLKYVGSYLIMMVFTFLITFLGLMVLRIERAPLIALIIAVLDVLPVIGVGTVLVPWSVIQFILGNHYLGTGLAILFLVIEILRQFLEPKILGKNLDTHPLVTLMLLYSGYSFFGIQGLLLIPFATVIINFLSDKNDSAEIT